MAYPQGKKSVIYNLFKKRYQPEEDEMIVYEMFKGRYQPNEFGTCTQIIVKNLSLPDCCLIAEGMNMIYKASIGLKTFLDYANFLTFHPKVFIQSRRDKGKEEGELTEILDSTLLPSNWQQFLRVRHNKHLLCNYLYFKFLCNVQTFLCVSTCTKFVVSGGFHRLFNSDAPITLFATVDGIFQYHMQTNHEKSDTQIFLHVYDTMCTTVHIKSIDRDIGLIGLPLLCHFHHKQVYVEYKSHTEL